MHRVVGVERSKAKPRCNGDTDDDQGRLYNEKGASIVSRKGFRLENWDRYCAETNSYTSDDAGNEHLPVVVGSGLDSSANNNDDVCPDDGPLATNPLAVDKCPDCSQGTSNIIDGCDQTTHCGIGLAKHILESFTSKDATEQALVIAEEEKVDTRGDENDENKGLPPKLDEGHVGYCWRCLRSRTGN